MLIKHYQFILRTFLYAKNFIRPTANQSIKLVARLPAVTEIEIRATGAAPNPNQKPFKMIVNRPFIFMIYDNQTKLILFIGSIYHPEKIQ